MLDLINMAKSKLPCGHSQSLAKLIREACGQCMHGGSCLRTPSTLSSLGESLDGGDLDRRQLVMLEMQSRAAMKAKKRAQELATCQGSKLAWATPPTTGRAHLSTPTKKKQEEEVEEDGGGGRGDEASEEFFSVKSCFSCSSVDGSTTTELKDERGVVGGGGRSIWAEFRHCKGWPFGLCRRAVVLPPLPASPSDSWMWHKRNLVVGHAKTNCTVPS